MSKYRRYYAVLLTTLLFVASTQAQCPMENTAFDAGERLEYKLYFNWKFVWIHAGIATMTIDNTTYEGQQAYKSLLVTSTSKRIDKYFCMRDTLTSVVTQNLVPLYYRKGANEGNKYRINEIRYSYHSGNSYMNLLYVNSQGEKTSKTLSDAGCVYDMLSMMLRARSMDGSNFKEGDKIKFLMADGRDVETQTLVYRGKKKFKTEETKITYRCMVFSFVEYVGKKEKEIITFYITDDENHLPVRLDMFLRFGVAKAYLKDCSGIRHPQTSIIEKK